MNGGDDDTASAPMEEGNSDGDINADERRPLLTDVLLPGEDYVVDHWTAGFGSAVRLGETIAISRRRRRPSKHIGNGGGSSDVSDPPTTTAQSGAPLAHKRPNRRRRPGGGGGNAGLQQRLPEQQPANKSVTAGLGTSDGTRAPNSTAFSSSSSSTAYSLRERLAAKLSSKKVDPSGGAESRTLPPAGPAVDASDDEVGSASSSANLPSSSHDTTAIGNNSVESETIPIRAPASGLLRANTANPDRSLFQGQTELAIGHIEECLHPTYVDGMCVVCGTPMPKGSSSTLPPLPVRSTAGAAAPAGPQNRNGDDDALSHLTVSGGVTMTVSQRESRQMALLDSERLFRQRRLSLVLDLDHTLVHATPDVRARRYLQSHGVRSIRLPMLEGAPPGTSAAEGPRMWTHHYVKLRPHINAFLASVQPLYEVTVYTAGTRLYAEEITMVLSRSMVGSTLERDAIEQLRYQVRVAEAEYAKHKNLQEEAAKGDSTLTLSNRNDDDHKKRKADEAIPMDDEGGDDMDEGDDDTSRREQARKRKRVSFGFQETGGDEETSAQRSDHMTKETLEHLQAQLREADDLEQKALDLRQRLFGSRVVSRTDVGDLGRDVKSLRRIFPCGGSMAAVVDDREDVWANAKDNTQGTAKGEPPDNLLLVRPYHWLPFVGFADINNPAGADLSGLRNDETDSQGENDRQLLWTMDILERLHQRYYQQSEGRSRLSVPEILKNMRNEVLKVSTLVLSGLVPLHKQRPGSSESRPAFIRYAETLGARIKDRVEDGVTHVVAANDGTDKAMAARRVSGCVLVKQAWLMESYWSMTNRDVEPFLWDRGVASVPKFTPNNDETMMLNESNAENSIGGSSNDSGDDDFAAELEEEFMSD